MTQFLKPPSTRKKDIYCTKVIKQLRLYAVSVCSLLLLLSLYLTMFCPLFKKETRTLRKYPSTPVGRQWAKSRWTPLLLTIFIHHVSPTLFSFNILTLSRLFCLSSILKFSVSFSLSFQSINAIYFEQLRRELEPVISLRVDTKNPTEFFPSRYIYTICNNRQR